MGTLADLKARILDECRGVTPRLIGQHVTRAIEAYATQRFWFNQGNGTVTTSAGVSTVTKPTGLRREDLAMITANGSPYTLCQRSNADIDQMLAENSSQGQPSDYAVVDAVVKLYPTPAGAYTLTMTGIYDEAALSADSSSNAWTTEAVDLIAARAKATLYRDILKDPENARAASLAERDELYRLRGETASRISSGILKAG